MLLPRSSSDSQIAFITVVESTGMGTDTPVAAVDLLVAADEDVEHDAVDAVVFAVVGDGPHGRCALAESVDSAFALFVAGGVPGEVVVHDGGEAVLQVDALGEAVGGDQQAGPFVVGEGVDAKFAFLGWQGCRSPRRCAGRGSSW